MKFQGVRFAVIALLIASAASAATITTYSTQSAFSNASTAVTTVDFTTTALGNNTTPEGLAFGSTSVVGYDQNPGCPACPISNFLSVVDSTIGPAHYPWGTRAVKGPNGSLTNSYLQINFIGVTAIALNLATFWEGKDVRITLSTGESYIVNTSAILPATFWGFTSDVAQTYVRIATVESGGFLNGSPLLLDYQYGSVAAEEPPPAETPEAMTFVLIASGLFFLRGLKRFGPASPAA